MGYETRLYVLLPYYAQTKDTEPIVGSVIAMVDLSKAGYYNETGKCLSEARDAGKREGKFYAFYGSDGDTLVTEDPYGDRLTAVDRNALVAAMTKDHAEEPYRRFHVALGLLNSFRPEDWANELDRFVVVQYGH